MTNEEIMLEALKSIERTFWNQFKDPVKEILNIVRVALAEVRK